MGLSDGSAEGISDGSEDGLSVGIRDGEEVGSKLGARVGLIDGAAVGDGVGLNVSFTCTQLEAELMSCWPAAQSRNAPVPSQPLS